MGMSEGIIVAAIAAVGTVLAALVQVMRKENKNDHNIVADSLNRIETKLDNHIDDHLKGEI
jgi:Na+-translocating ferredoxin:NAD+ oxidoreductase RnfG subunit